MLSRLCVVMSLVIGVTIGFIQPSVAGGHCPPGTTAVPSPDGGSDICIAVADPGTPDDPGQGGTTPTDSGGGCHRADGSPVPCVAVWGTWDDADQCWAHRVYIPRNDPVWDGHTDGSIWMCALIDDTTPTVTWWVPPGATPAPVDPGELAKRAVGLLSLATAEVHTAPQAPDHSFVGVENWLWVPSAQWTTLTKTMSAGGTSVTVTARPDRVTWDLGPAAMTCQTPGAEWRVGMTDAAVTTCGYTYTVTSRTQPDGAFHLSAQIQYQVDWTCAGACTSESGTLGLIDAPAGTGSLQVLQRQTVVVR